MKLWAEAVDRTATEGPATALDRTVAPPLAPAQPAIDLAHLAGMTLGESSLEREVLQLFDRQAAMLLARMGDASPPVVAALAHTLIGSARGVGAWKVAEAAQAVERLAAQRGRVALTGAVNRLAAVVTEARLAIGDLLRAR